MSNKEKAKKKYDERQKNEQGRGYFFAFWALIIYLTFMILFEAAFEKELLSSTAKCYLGMCIGIGTYIVYCIFKDAYFPLGGSVPTILVTNITALAVLVIGIIGFNDASFDEKFVLIVLLSLMAIVDISIFAHHRIERKRERDGE